MNLLGNMIDPVCIGINPDTVSFQIGNGDFQAADLFDGRIDIHLRHATISRDIEITLCRPFAVGVAGGNAGQAVGQAVMDR